MKELIKIQGELKAPKTQTNSFGKYKYRSCEDILEAVKPLCIANNCLLVISDEMKEVGGRIYVVATVSITNESGEIVASRASAREAESKKGMDDSQITGAASSYARKHALNGLFLIDDTKDNDTDETSSLNQTYTPTTKVLQPDSNNTPTASFDDMLTGAMIKSLNDMEAHYKKSNNKEGLSYLADLRKKPKAEVASGILRFNEKLLEKVMGEG